MRPVANETGPKQSDASSPENGVKEFAESGGRPTGRVARTKAKRITLRSHGILTEYQLQSEWPALSRRESSPKGVEVDLITMDSAPKRVIMAGTK